MTLVGIVGYDSGLVARLDPRDARFFKAATIIAVIAALLGGVGTGYAAMLSFGLVAGVGAGIGFALFIVNLIRLLHAGSGYPVHRPIEEIEFWSPAATAAGVLILLGLLLAQPLVMLLMSPFVGAHGGIVEQARACWQHPLPAAGLTLAFATLISAPGWLRLLGAGSVRAYERERWIDDRMFVDDAFADSQDAITRLLEGVPGFKPPLQVHYADPPYNTRPLIYGLDPSFIVQGGIKYVKAKDAPAPAPLPPEPAPAAAPPPPRPPPPPPAPAEPPPPARSDDKEEVAIAWDDPAHDADTEPPPISYLDIGRLQAKRAREHVELVVPFITRFTGRPESDVRGLLRAAPDDMRVHKLFGDWKTLRAILLKDAGFALDHGLAPVLSIVTQKPVADVERRLRAAPREKRLTGVFAPELARRLLNKKVSAASG